jgi:hypothetical protein
MIVCRQELDGIRWRERIFRIAYADTRYLGALEE